MASGEKYAGDFINGYYFEGLQYVNGNFHGEGFLLKDNGDTIRGVYEYGVIKKADVKLYDYEG
jgi:hypothetical protein